MMILELVAFSIFIVVFFAIMAHNLFLIRKKRKLISVIIQLETDKDILMKKLAEALAAKESATNVEQTEGFLKFISESRDWAFKYIEDVQAAISKFGAKAQPELIYLDRYGTTIGLSMVKSVETISEAYRELLKVMPEASDDKDQQQG
jgi:hypothetical protein